MRTIAETAHELGVSESQVRDWLRSSGHGDLAQGAADRRVIDGQMILGMRKRLGLYGDRPRLPGEGQAGPAFAETPMPELQQRLEDLQSRKAELLAQGERMRVAWFEAFPQRSMPVYPARTSHESNTYFRWRRSTGATKRASRCELFDVEERILALPKAVREQVLEFERRRIQFNLDFACCAYELSRVEDLIRHRSNLGKLRKAHREAA